MLKTVITILILLPSFSLHSNESSLTIQQQLERLQREVSDISQTVFSNKSIEDNGDDNNDVVTNLSAIDMRIYDLEKDVKNLTANFEDVLFQIEDLVSEINNFEKLFTMLEKKLLKINEDNLNTINQKQTNNLENQNNIEDNSENTLGSLKITSENKEIKNNENTIKDTNELDLSPEDKFQIAFDNIRDRNWKEAKINLKDFIKNYPENQLSGSAHYWLGELHILEKDYRDAALVLAEGYQKFPKSIKAPDMLYKLSLSLYSVNKEKDSCKTLEKLILDYPKNKYIKNAKKQIQDYGCLEANE